MHDADDATLMGALRRADPLAGDAVGPAAQHRLERDWRQARDPVDATRAAPPLAPARPPLQLVAALVILAIVIAAGIAVVANVVARPAVVERPPVSIATPYERPSTPASRYPSEPSVVTSEQALLDPPVAPDAVDGSYRALRQQGDAPPQIIEVVGGRARVRLGVASMVRVPTSWRGFAGATPVTVEGWIEDSDTHLVLAGPSVERHAAWYRQAPPPDTPYHPTVYETTIPRFSRGTAGFRRIGDVAAAARGMTRWTADVADADLAFLGYFAPTWGNVGYAPGKASIDVWVDEAGRVRRFGVVGADDPTVVRFGAFDSLTAIDDPSDGDGDALPVASARHGMTVDFCGDPAAADALRAEVHRVLDGDPDVASYRILPKPTPAQDLADDTAMEPDDRVFMVAATLRDGVHPRRALNRAANGPLGTLAAADPGGQRHASVCSIGSTDWLELGS